MKNREINLIDINDRRDYISMDHESAISAHGIIFRVGDGVYHDDPDDDTGIGIIRGFRFDYNTMNIIAETDKGWSRIVFLSHEKPKSLFDK